MRPFFSFIIGGISLVLLTGLALASPFAYITNFSSNSVSVIDAATNGVVSTISVGNGPQPVAVNPAGTRVYVGNSSANTV